MPASSADPGSLSAAVVDGESFRYVKMALVAPVVHLEQEPAVAPAGLDAPQDVEVGRALDPFRGAARHPLRVDDLAPLRARPRGSGRDLC